MNKQQEILLSNILYYGLCGKNPSFFPTDELSKTIPSGCFGVFSTIRRHQTLSKWPKDIHGCQGYWNEKYTAITKSELLKHCLDVTYKAIYKDNRKDHFGPLENDPYSLLEIDFLKKPLYNIDSKSGKITYKNKQIPFNNNKFGVIIQGLQSHQRATFLPHVFTNKPWNYIKKQLFQKGQLNEDDKHVKLYAYEIVQYKMKLIQLLKYKDFFKKAIQSFSDLLFKNVNKKNKYVFFYSITKNKKIYDNSQDVRNCALLGSLFQMYKNRIITLTPEQLLLLKKEAKKLLNNIEPLSSQALSFLGPFIPLYNNTTKNTFCNKLKKDLPHVDKDFATPEILIGLKISQCKIPLRISLTCKADDNIFKYNWTIQAHYFLYNKIPTTLLTLFKKKINEINKKIQNTETNILAVTLEAICYIFKYTNEEKWLALLFPIFVELEKRKTGLTILYAFTNGECRVDISDHIYRGFSMLLSKK
jgi:hypothetical protein